MDCGKIIEWRKSPHLSAFDANPNMVQRFYNDRRAQLLSGEVNPNAAHLALADFEMEFDGDFLLVTQNVDNLHERAGSQNILHMHGELMKIRCLDCGSVQTIYADVNEDSRCLQCESPRVRPHIVWFGEMPMEMDAIQEKLYSCDLFVSIGTSNNVYPAAGFMSLAKESGAKCVELNLEETQLTQHFDQSLFGPPVKLCPHFLKSFSEEYLEHH